MQGTGAEVTLKSLFMLDPRVTFLNHGSFGACPRPVFEVYQTWQRRLERQPLAFYRRAGAHMAAARGALAAYLHCAEDELVFFPNPTTALNMLARSLALTPGDEVLSSDHEYGALDRTWRFICAQTGARYVRRPIPLPLASPEATLESLWAGLSSKTRAVFLSHITSPTALRFPVEEVCARARADGLISIIDGAHAPGQIALDLSALGADFYAGACHKWLCAPKGSAFLYARRDVQHLLQPLVVSWGWEADAPGPSRYVDHHEWQGTRDLAAFLATPAAIQFQHDHDWEAVRARCRRLTDQTQRRIDALTGLEPLCQEPAGGTLQMCAARLPELDAASLQRRLYDEHRIEVVAQRWNDQPLLRVSFQAYNEEADAARLVGALEAILPDLT